MILLPVEIAVGDWITVVDTRPGPFCCERPRFDGKPLEVRSVDLPFVIASLELERIVIDLRAWQVKRVTAAYVRAFCNPAAEHLGRGRFAARMVFN